MGWDLLDRIADKFTVGDGCWEWTASIATTGYGKVWTQGRTLGAHRVVYEIMVGPIPDGLHLDHLCRNRACVRPSHLEPVTLAENNRRSKALKTRCTNGHEFDNATTYIDPRGHRQCRICRRANVSRHAAKAGG